MTYEEVVQLAKAEIVRILPSEMFDWGVLGHQLDSLDRIEFVENLSTRFSLNLDLLLLKPEIWNDINTLSRFLFNKITESQNG